MKQINLTGPLNVVHLHNFLAPSYMTLTNLGGIQEEAPSLRKTVLVVNNTTAHPKGIKVGTLRLVGTNERCIYDLNKVRLNNRAEDSKMSISNTVWRRLRQPTDYRCP